MLRLRPNPPDNVVVRRSFHCMKEEPEQMRTRYLVPVLLLLVAVGLLATGGRAVASTVPPLLRCEAQGPVGPLDAYTLYMPRQVWVCGNPVVRAVPFQDAWAFSGHNNVMSRAFRNWDAAGSIPVACAKCHSSIGYLDFLGADGSAPGVVDEPSPLGTTVDCVACHNQVTLTKTSVTFPSGITVHDLGDESRCMECHQGRQSGPQVEAYLAGRNLANEDQVDAGITFQNIHYFAAAATQYGTMVKGGYEYPGKSYDSRYAHVEGYNTCYSCHDMHTLQINFAECATCHPGVNSGADVARIRMAGSRVDYDGDGNTTEGIGEEIAGLQALLYTAIRRYAEQVSGRPIVYDPNTHPYFFVDTNNNGQVDPGENTAANRYNAFTARLLKAAFNYQVSQKDPGTFAHGGKYIIQLLHDSIADLNTRITPPVNMANARRDDPGHFAGSKEAFRHWDSTGTVPGACAKCHTAEGVPFFLREGVNISAKPSNGLMCSTCHSDLRTWARHTVNQVTFPSGATVSLADRDNNLCLLCHQGRSSTVQVNTAIAGLPLDGVSATLRFLNIHYFSAGATLFGNDVKGLYQYEGLTYRGRNTHVPTYDACTECHATHRLEVEFQECRTCHPNVNSPADLRNIRFPTSVADYDGDGNTTEGIYYEGETMAAKLYDGIKLYAQQIAGRCIVYDAQSYPYFFVDANCNGVKDADETTGFNAWTPRLLRAAYNYQYWQKDPGGFAHNGKYVLQALYDSIFDLKQAVNIDTTGMVRP